MDSRKRSPVRASSRTRALPNRVISGMDAVIGFRRAGPVFADHQLVPPGHDAAPSALESLAVKPVKPWVVDGGGDDTIRRVGTVEENGLEGTPDHPPGDRSHPKINQRRGKINQGNGMFDPAAGSNAPRPVEDEGHPKRGVVTLIFAAESVRKQLVAVIGAEHDEGVVGDAETVERVQQAANGAINPHDLCVIKCPHLACFFGQFGGDVCRQGCPGKVGPRFLEEMVELGGQFVVGLMGGAVGESKHLGTTPVPGLQHFDRTIRLVKRSP